MGTFLLILVGIAIALAFVAILIILSAVGVSMIEETKAREEVFWTRMEPPTEDVLGQEFEYEGKMVKVVDYNPEGIATLTIEPV